MSDYEDQNPNVTSFHSSSFSNWNKVFKCGADVAVKYPSGFSEQTESNKNIM